MGNEASSVHHIEQQPKERQAFRPLFSQQLYQTTRTISPQPSKKSLIQQPILLDIPQQKKKLSEINKHVESLYSYQKQREEKIRFQQKEKEYQQEQECTFKPDTGRQDLSTTRRSFREFLADQQTFQQKKNQSIQKQTKLKQDYMKSQEPIRREPKSPPNQEAFERLYGQRKLPPKPKSKSKNKSPANTSRARTKGQELYQTFRQKQAKKVVPQVPKPNIQMNENSEEILYARGVREFLQDLNQTVKDKFKISYIEFCEMFQKIGFTKTSVISDTMIKERSLVYDAWGMLISNGSVDYRSLLSFCFAVLGFDLSKYWQDPSEKTVIIKGTQESYHNEPLSLIENEQTIDHFFPNQRQKLMGAYDHRNFSQTSGANGWSSVEPSIRLGQTKLGYKMFTAEQIPQIRQHFLTFSVNRLNSKKNGPIEVSPAKKSPRSKAEEQMFRTRRARILDEALKEGLIKSVEGISHADYLLVLKKLEQLKVKRQREIKQKESLAEATFQPVISNYEFKNQENIRDRMRFTAQQRCHALYEKAQNSSRTFHTAPPPPEDNSCTFMPNTSKGKIDTNPVYAKNIDKFVSRIRNTAQKREQVDDYLNDRGAAKVPTLTPDKQQSGEETEVVLHVDVNVDSNRIERVSLRPGDNPRKVAIAFVQKHSLDNRFTDPLTKLLTLHLARLQ